ncbi:MAG: aminotransferase class V-fold PLP-dependent enzyme [Firmicutes bacterium]|nr:aminotransferase class V-fold PLP-dependent enzyme [Bacillota bacterium]
MYSFRNDYSEGAHPAVLNLLQETNFVQSIGYGEDEYCLKAKELILQEMAPEKADIYFVSGGTQANMLAIAAVLRPHEAVIAAASGHICVHEAGAIEATGHKILTTVAPQGKLTAELILPLLKAHEQDHHMVKPRLVYISNSTETGTVYSAEELASLREFCQERQLLLYVDGARLGAALTAPHNNLTMADMAAYTDFFSIGGTKNGALFGEALVIKNEILKNDFIYQVKQRGALLAKGRVLGLQFLALFSEGLYYKNARHANEQALRLKEGLLKRGFRLYANSSTNQQFVIMPHSLGKRLIEEYQCELWQVTEQEMVLRFVTSWATPEQAIDELLGDLDQSGI